MLRQKRFLMMILACSSVLMGIFALIWPTESLAVLTYALAIVLISYGAVRAVGYFFQRECQGFYDFSLVTAGVCLIIGIVIFAKQELVRDSFAVVMACVLLVSGLVKLQNALDLRRMNYAGWLPVLILSLITVALSVMVFLRPSDAIDVMVRIIGGTLLLDGCMNFWAIHCLHKKLKELEEMESDDDL